MQESTLVSKTSKCSWPGPFYVSLGTIYLWIIIYQDMQVDLHFKRASVEIFIVFPLFQ